MAPITAARPIARLARATGTWMQAAMGAAFLLSACVLAFAAASGVHLGMGRQVMASSHVLWSAALCLALGFGMLVRQRLGRRVPAGSDGRPERPAAAPNKAERASARRSASQGPAPGKVSPKRPAAKRRTGQAP